MPAYGHVHAQLPVADSKQVGIDRLYMATVYTFSSHQAVHLRRNIGRTESDMKDTRWSTDQPRGAIGTTPGIAPFQTTGKNYVPTYCLLASLAPPIHASCNPQMARQPKRGRVEPPIAVLIANVMHSFRLTVLFWRGCNTTIRLLM